MSGRSPEELKNALIARAQKRDEITPEDFEEAIEEITDFEQSPEDADMGDPSVEEFLEDALAQVELVETIDALYADGFESFVNGLTEEDNPCEDEEEAEVWNEGWQGAYVHACVSDLLLAVKEFVDAADADAADAALNRILESFPFVEDVVNLDEAQEFLDELHNSEE
jgi:hypothetical protein